MAVARTEAGEDAIAAATQKNRLESLAKARASTPWGDSTEKFESRNKHTAINSDLGGEMVGVLTCLRLFPLH